ncbi:MAG: response regulator [Isosphaeraceae bacterium]|nr:response regulator [Isosphaeraceae bacterium]
MATDRSVVEGPRGLRVLIVEDDPNCRWVLCALMKRMGYECQVATDGQAALRMAEEFAPQVILMDLMMPVLDGWEATRRLKADERMRSIPVLALTGDATPDGESAARRAGCDDFVPKPIIFPDLLERLHRLVTA